MLVLGDRNEIHWSAGREAGSPEKIGQEELCLMMPMIMVSGKSSEVITLLPETSLRLSAFISEWGNEETVYRTKPPHRIDCQKIWSTPK